MDKYLVYHNIKTIHSILSQYPAASEFADQLVFLANQLSTRTYRVAVIGEFKRGKSSLVNCLLGTEILPTDILPTTAVVNRIVYGTEQKIEIFYKDGTVKSTTVAELAEYATKKNEANAFQIREIVVHYPSVFCQNNIELLDTPGLNDDEFMDKTTLDVLDKIDTAIVTTHASYPISETEKKLICKLIEQEDIYHLTFVATFIDRISDEPKEQDRVVALIRRRLAGIYTQFCQNHQNDYKLQEKAKRILCEPVVFAVSSRLAMRGFVNGNKKMLDESRFPHFKYELSALLTANQELDLQLKAMRLIHVANENFISWHENLLNKLEVDLAEARACLQLSQAYQKSGCEGLMDRLMQVDQDLERSGILLKNKIAFDSSGLVRQATWIVMKHLLRVNSQTVSVQSVKSVLIDASKELESVTDNNLEQLVHECMQKANEHLIAAEKKSGLGDKLTCRLTDWKKTAPFPQIDKNTYDLEKMVGAYAAEEKIRAGDILVLTKWVTETISSRMYTYYVALQEQLGAYIASWRSQLLKQNLADKNEMSTIAEHAAQQIRNIRQQKDAVIVNYNTNLDVLMQTEKELNSLQS